MNIDNKRALIILAIVIVILVIIVIITGKIVTGVEVEPKNLKVDNDISKKIDWIVDGKEEPIEEEEKTNIIEE